MSAWGCDKALRLYRDRAQHGKVRPDDGEASLDQGEFSTCNLVTRPAALPWRVLGRALSRKIAVASDPSAVPHAPKSQEHGHGATPGVLPHLLASYIFGKRTARAFDVHDTVSALTVLSWISLLPDFALAHHRMRVTLLPALMLTVAPAVTAFAPGAGFSLAKMGAPAVVQPRAPSMSARRPARLMDLKATAAYPLQETITGGPRDEADYTVPEWRKKVDLAAWANEVREVEKKYRAQQSVEEDVAHMKKMLNWTYVLYAVGKFPRLAVSCGLQAKWRQGDAGAAAPYVTKAR